MLPMFSNPEGSLWARCGALRAMAPFVVFCPHSARSPAYDHPARRFRSHVRPFHAG